MKNLIVMSNKGGVGKTTVAVNLALNLAKKYEVGLLDIDIHVPNVPEMLGMKQENLRMTEKKKIIPAHYATNLHVVSISFATENQDDPIIWRGPMKTNLIMQFTKDVEWGKLDYLVIDSPPGTGDEVITIMQNLKDNLEAIIVSTPNDLSMADAKKALNMCYKFNVPVTGFIENMAGDIFGSGAVEEYAKKMNAPFLGRIELSKEIADLSKSQKIEETFDKIIKKLT